LLIRSGVFNIDAFFKTFNEKLKRHFMNYGRFNQAVSEASFDTWIDGYVAGIPHRKTSIYTEGSLCAFMLDLIIREYSNNSNSLDDLMRKLYTGAKQNIGYSRARIIELLKSLAEYDFESFYTNYIEHTNDFEPLLTELLDRVGLTLNQHLPLSKPEHEYGFTLSENGGFTTVSLVAPGSPAENAGIMIGDQLLACNGVRLRSNFQLLTENKNTNNITLFSHEKLKNVVLTTDSQLYFTSRVVQLSNSMSKSQKTAFDSWLNLVN